MKLGEGTKVSTDLKTILSIAAGVAVGVWAYFGLHETLNTHATKIELMQKEVLSDIKNRLARAEATWDMAENIFQQLADQVRQHEYDIKDLNR